MMRSFPWLVLFFALLAGCSSDSFKRSVYSTLQNMEQGRCRTHDAEPCAQQEGYDDYQQRRKELEQAPQ